MTLGMIYDRICKKFRQSKKRAISTPQNKFNRQKKIFWKKNMQISHPL